MHRRTFLSQSTALAAVAGGIDRLDAAQRTAAVPNNIIWMVADGMSAGVLPLAEHFSQRARRKGTIWQSLLDRPNTTRAFMDMASLLSIVTDSSAASSSWGSGSRIFNAWINMLPDGTALIPIGHLARAQRKKVGLVTTTTVTHATPAGFAAVSKQRDDEAFIATQYRDVCDIVLGGGLNFFDPARRRDKRDLLAHYRAGGFTTVQTAAELKQTTASRILGLFAGNHLPYTLDRLHNAELAARTPTLAEMTAVALRRLSASSNGFLLQVEGGRVDHAAHDNDSAAMLWEQLAFDDAIEVVLAFAESHPDTLVVITTDHGNSNPGLNGMGTEYKDSNECFDRLLAFRNSYSTATPRMTRGRTPEQIAAVVKEAFGVTLTAPELDRLVSAASGRKAVAINGQFDKLVGVLGQTLSNYTGVGWTGTSHTSDYTIVTALGPGSQNFQGFLRNTEVFPHLCTFIGSKHRNPTMTPERARQFLNAAAHRVQQPHWV